MSRRASPIMPFAGGVRIARIGGQIRSPRILERLRDGRDVASDSVGAAPRRGGRADECSAQRDGSSRLRRSIGCARFPMDGRGFPQPATRSWCAARERRASIRSPPGTRSSSRSVPIRRAIDCSSFGNDKTTGDSLGAERARSLETDRRRMWTTMFAGARAHHACSMMAASFCRSLPPRSRSASSSSRVPNQMQSLGDSPRPLAAGERHARHEARDGARARLSRRCVDEQGRSCTNTDRSAAHGTLCRTLARSRYIAC